jgi:hypothetical protein
MPPTLPYLPQYQQEFREAIDRAEAFGAPTKVDLMPTPRPMPVQTRQQIHALAQQTFGEDGAFLCVNAAEFACHLIREAGWGACLTLGYLSTPSGPLWRVSPSDIQQWLSTPPDPSSVSVHAWVTLPNLEILDPTFLRSAMELKQVLITHPAAPSTDVQHRPVVAGEPIARLLFGRDRYR